MEAWQQNMYVYVELLLWWFAVAYFWLNLCSCTVLTGLQVNECFTHWDGNSKHQIKSHITIVLCAVLFYTVKHPCVPAISGSNARYLKCGFSFKFDWRDSSSWDRGGSSSCCWYGCSTNCVPCCVVVSVLLRKQGVYVHQQWLQIYGQEKWRIKVLQMSQNPFSFRGWGGNRGARGETIRLSRKCDIMGCLLQQLGVISFA